MCEQHSHSAWFYMVEHQYLLLPVSKPTQPCLEQWVIKITIHIGTYSPRGGASFLCRLSMKEPSAGNSSISFINTFTADSTTAALEWDSLEVTRSQILHSNSMLGSITLLNAHLCASLSAGGV